MLKSSGRDGAVLWTLMDGLGNAGVTVKIPTGLNLRTLDVPITPGIIGDPVTVPLPDVTDPLEVVWEDVSITTVASTIVDMSARVDELKSDVSSFARGAGGTAIADAIDAVWDSLKAKITVAVKTALDKLVEQLVVSITEEIRGTPMTPAEAARIASGGLAEALELADEAMHHAEGHTSIEHRLAQGDLADSSRAVSRGQGMADDFNDMSAEDQAGSSLGAADRDQDGSISAEELPDLIAAQRRELVARVGEVRGAGTEDDPWIPVVPLPPSHSEIGKDHPPHSPDHHDHAERGPDAHPEILHPDAAPAELLHADEDNRNRDLKHKHDQDSADVHKGQSAGPGGDEHQHGSSFYGLGVALAREAQRHMYRQVESAWSAIHGEHVNVADLRDEQGKLVSEEAGVAGSAASARRDASMETGHEDVISQARTRAGEEATHYAAAGFARTQDSEDAQSLGAQHPEVTDLLNLVDLYVSHPNDSSWWRTVMDTYVRAHSDEVYHHIQRRNGTRSYRPS